MSFSKVRKLTVNKLYLHIPLTWYSTKYIACNNMIKYVDLLIKSIQRNGNDEAGIYVACDVINRMITLEGQTSFDVFNTVQRIRQKRPQFIANFVSNQYLGMRHLNLTI